MQFFKSFSPPHRYIVAKSCVSSTNPGLTLEVGTVHLLHVPTIDPEVAQMDVNVDDL